MKKFENMMLNRRQALALGLSGAATMALAACGGGNSGGGNAGGGDEKVEATVTVWGPQEDQSDDNGKWLQTQCDAFAAAHPDWTLTFKYGVCPEGDAKTNIGTDPSAGADVYMFANDQIPDLLKAGGIAELGGSTLDAIKANNSETTVNTVTYDGAVYGVPFTGNTWFMYYDKSVFSDEDVKSLDAMLEKDYRRDCCIIAVGGGVVTDLAGFIAGTFGRGVPFINFRITTNPGNNFTVAGIKTLFNYRKKHLTRVGNPNHVSKTVVNNFGFANYH